MTTMSTPIIGEESSLPEVPAADLNVAILNAAIAKHGVILVRGLLSESTATQLDHAFQTALTAATKRFGGNRDWYTPFDDGTTDLGIARKWVQNSDCTLLADSPAMLRQVLDTYRRAAIIDLVAAHLGETPVLSSRKSTLRRTVGSRVYPVGWHQDGAFLGPGTRVLNVWLALTPCGERAASVEIGLTRQAGIVPTGGGDAKFNWAVGHKQAMGASPRSVVPVCAPGDALMFDQLCLHRTSIGPAYSEDRRALETWFFAPSTYPTEYDPRPIRL